MPDTGHWPEAGHLLAHCPTSQAEHCTRGAYPTMGWKDRIMRFLPPRLLISARPQWSQAQGLTKKQPPWGQETGPTVPRGPHQGQTPRTSVAPPPAEQTRPEAPNPPCWLQAGGEGTSRTGKAPGRDTGRGRAKLNPWGRQPGRQAGGCAPTDSVPGKSPFRCVTHFQPLPPRSLSADYCPAAQTRTRVGGTCRPGVPAQPGTALARQVWLRMS